MNRPLQLLDSPAARGVDVERRLQFFSQALDLASRLATCLLLRLERRAEMPGFLRRTRGRAALPFERRARAGEIVAKALKVGSLRGEIAIERLGGQPLSAQVSPQRIRCPPMRVELRSQGDCGSARFGDLTLCLGGLVLRLGDRDACILLRLQLRLERRPHRRRFGFSCGDARQVDDEPLQRRRRVGLGQGGFERGEARLELGAQGFELAPGVCRERLPDR